MNGPWEGQSIFERLFSVLNPTIYIYSVYKGDLLIKLEYTYIKESCLIDEDKYFNLRLKYQLQHETMTVIYSIYFPASSYLVFVSVYNFVGKITIIALK